MTFAIVQNIIFPIFILIGSGILLHRKFKLDLHTLSKVTFFLLIPPVVFVKIYQSELSLSLISLVLLFIATIYVGLYLLTKVLIFLFKIDKPIQQNFINGALLTNQGNFGLPVNELVFRGDPYAMSIQIVVMTLQNFITFTYGILSFQKWGKDSLLSMIKFIKNPILLALFLGLIMKLNSISVPPFVLVPLENATNAFLAIALITLGAQVACINIKSFLVPTILSSFCKLVASPLIAIVFIYSFNLEGILAQALFIASAFPTASNSALLALEYKSNPEFAGQIVLVSTLLSSLTVTVVIYLAHVLF